MNIAIIPARGGSKRIPHKNLRDFCGKPIIDWSIETARASGLFERIIVSTDCERIAEVARASGAETPFVRPDHLADDLTPTVPVIRHAVEWLLREDLAAAGSLVCCLYPTAPFVTSADLRRGCALLHEDPGLEFAVSVTSFAFPIQRALIIENGRLRMMHPEHELTRSQDLPAAWHDAGQFYWGRMSAFLHRDRMFSSRTAPVMLPTHRVQDIDTPEDWVRAEHMFHSLSSTGA